jgi:hypothetical protein
MHSRPTPWIAAAAIAVLATVAHAANTTTPADAAGGIATGSATGCPGGRVGPGRDRDRSGPSGMRGAMHGAAMMHMHGSNMMHGGAMQGMSHGGMHGHAVGAKHGEGAGAGHCHGEAPPSTPAASKE